MPRHPRLKGPAPWLKLTDDGEAPACWAAGCRRSVEAAWLRYGCGTFCGRHHRQYHVGGEWSEIPDFQTALELFEGPHHGKPSCAITRARTPQGSRRGPKRLTGASSDRVSGRGGMGGKGEGISFVQGRGLSLDEYP